MADEEKSSSTNKFPPGNAVKNVACGSNPNDRNDNSELSSPELEGIFRHNKKCFLCCNKIIYLRFVLTKNKLIFYLMDGREDTYNTGQFEKDKKKIYKIIDKNSVVCINKRQLGVKDLFNISIHYKAKNKNKLEEFKVKCASRVDNERWLYLLNQKIPYQRYDFQFEATEFEDLESKYKITNLKDFYLSLCHLEYILGRGKMRKFFYFYGERIEKELDEIEKMDGRKYNSQSFVEAYNKIKDSSCFMAENREEESDDLIYKIKGNSDRSDGGNIDNNDSGKEKEEIDASLSGGKRENGRNEREGDKSVDVNDIKIEQIVV